MLDLDLNPTGLQRILATNGKCWTITPPASTQNTRRSLNRVDGLAVVAILLLQCSPSFVTDWQRTLEHRSWLDDPVEVCAMRWSRMMGKVDAVLVVRREDWARFALTGRGVRRLLLNTVLEKEIRR